ncbi:hypothetical protein Tco_1201342 [Tanacetum coccineum]
MLTRCCRIRQPWISILPQIREQVREEYRERGCTELGSNPHTSPPYSTWLRGASITENPKYPCSRKAVSPFDAEKWISPLQRAILLQVFPSEPSKSVLKRGVPFHQRKGRVKIGTTSIRVETDISRTLSRIIIGVTIRKMTVRDLTAGAAVKLPNSVSRREPNGTESATPTIYQRTGTQHSQQKNLLWIGEVEANTNGQTATSFYRESEKFVWNEELRKELEELSNVCSSPILTLLICSVEFRFTEMLQEGSCNQPGKANVWRDAFEKEVVVLIAGIKCEEEIIRDLWSVWISRLRRNLAIIPEILISQDRAVALMTMAFYGRVLNYAYQRNPTPSEPLMTEANSSRIYDSFPVRANDYHKSKQTLLMEGMKADWATVYVPKNVSNKEIVRLHGTPSADRNSDRDPLSTSRSDKVYRKLGEQAQENLGFTIYDLVEFAYNKQLASSINAHLFEIDDEVIIEKGRHIAREKLKEAHTRQKSYARQTSQIVRVPAGIISSNLHVSLIHSNRSGRISQYTEEPESILDRPWTESWRNKTFSL